MDAIDFPNMFNPFPTADNNIIPEIKEQTTNTDCESNKIDSKYNKGESEIYKILEDDI